MSNVYSSEQSKMNFVMCPNPIFREIKSSAKLNNKRRKKDK